MFTLEQINEIHDRWGKADTLPEYLKALKAIGVVSYASYVTDGHSEYHGDAAYILESPPIHNMNVVATTSDHTKMMECLDLHRQGRTTYLEMSKGLAESGVEKWTFDTTKLTITYCDKNGDGLLTEMIK